MNEDQIFALVSNIGAVGILWWRLQRAQDKLATELEKLAKEVREKVAGVREEIIRVDARSQENGRRLDLIIGRPAVPRAVSNDITPGVPQ